MHKLIATFLLLALGALPALGQVAAPTLTPATPSPQRTPGFIPPNPAAMQWMLSSRIGVGQHEFESRSVNKTSGVVNESTLEGEQAGLLLVTGYGSLGLEGLDTEGEAGTSDIAYELRSGALAVPLFGVVALGASRGTTDLLLQSGGITLTSEQEETTWGVSLRLWDWFFLGATTGEQERTVTQSAPAIPFFATETLTRDVSRWGAGVRTQGETRWHLEYYEVDSDHHEGAIFVSPQEAEEAWVAEVVLADAWLLGTSGTEVQADNFVTGVTTTVKSRQHAVGYVPTAGFGIVFTQILSDFEDPTTLGTEETRSVTLLYHF